MQASFQCQSDQWVPNDNHLQSACVSLRRERKSETIWSYSLVGKYGDWLYNDWNARLRELGPGFRAGRQRQTVQSIIYV